MKKKTTGRGTRKISTKQPDKVETKTVEPDNKQAHAPFYNMSGIDRLNSIPDYTKIMDPHAIERTIMKYYVMGKNQLVAASKDPNNTVLEISIIGMMKILNNPDHKSYVDVNKYVQSRIGGKPREVIEHTGPGGGAIQTETTETVKLDLDNMTSVQLKALKKAREIEKAVIASVKKKNNDE